MSVVFAGVVGVAVGVKGQGVIANEQGEEETPTGGFVLPREDSKTIGKLEDFDRYVGKKAWDLAFRTMNELADAGVAGGTGGGGMVPAKDGFMVPLRRRVAQSLKDLPAEGRAAYRLFYDAEAKRLWEKLQTEQVAASEKLQALQKIVTRHFLTSVGDLAADRLGDIYFEQGDFGNAATAWLQVLRDYPDTQLSAVKLESKRCLALWRQGRSEELAGAVAQVKSRYAGQKVVFGGKEMAVEAFLEGLKLEGEKGRRGEGENLTAVVRFAADQKPLWQVKTLLPEAREQLEQQLKNMGWSYRSAITKGLLPATVADEKRVYVNWLGIVYAVDIETGKMLWRTGKFTEVAANPSNFIHYGADLQRFTLSVVGEKVFVIVGRNSGGETPYQLQCLNATTGKQLWKSDGVVALPYMMNGVGGVGYILGGGSERGRDEGMQFRALNVETGKEEWKLTLGKPQATTNYRGYRDLGTPTLVGTGGGDGIVYVATNNGALIAVNTSQRRIEWSFKHETRMAVPYRGWDDEMGFGDPSGTLMMSDGVLYVKDAGGCVLYAVDPVEPRLLWKRPLDGGARIVAVEGQVAYLFGKGAVGGAYFAALDFKSRDMLAWSEYLGTERTNLVPLLMKDRVYFLTASGVAEIDPALPVGNIHLRSTMRWGDRETSGGRLLLAGNKLISVTDLAVSAYEMGK